MPEQDLEQLVSLALRELPDERAPGTLLPRVLAAVAARQRRPWYARPAVTWSPMHQVSVATASLVALIVVLAYAAPAFVSFVVTGVLAAQTGWAAAVVNGAHGVGGAATAITALGGVASGLWRDYCAPLAFYAALLILLLAGALTAFATVLDHLTDTRTLSR